MDLPVGAVSRFPGEVPTSWTDRLPPENGCYPSIETWRVVAPQDLDLILNRSVGHSAIPEHRRKRSSAELVFEEHELPWISLSGQISKIENLGCTFVLGVRVRNVVKIIRHKEWNWKAAPVSRMLKKIRDFESVQDFMLLRVNKRKKSWPVPMVSIDRVTTVRLPRMIDFSQDFFGPSHPQRQFSWFAYGCAQIRRLDHHCIQI